MSCPSGSCAVEKYVEIYKTEMFTPYDLSDHREMGGPYILAAARC
jgi:hypothetical protein